MANRIHLQGLLKTNRLYGGTLTVEQCVELYERDTWLADGGEDYLEAWDAFCEGRCAGWQD